MPLLSEALQRQYREEGYLLIPGLLTERELDPVRELIAGKVDQVARQYWTQGKIRVLFENSAFERRLADIAAGADFPDRGWNHDIFGKAIYDLLTAPAILDAAESLIGPEVAVNGDYWIRPKLPNADTTTLPWHQDSGYYGEQTAASHILTMWIPLVDVDEQNGCMQCIPGSHRWGILPTKHNALGQNVPVTDVEDRGEVVTLPMKVGDVFAFHNLTFHRSLMNRSNAIRWSLDLRYSPIGTDVTWLDRHGYFGFVARSKAEPGSVETWDHWRGKWPEPSGK